MWQEEVQELWSRTPWVQTQVRHKIREALGKSCNLPFLRVLFCGRENNDAYIVGLFGRVNGMIYVRCSA